MELPDDAFAPRFVHICLPSLLLSLFSPRCGFCHRGVRVAQWHFGSLVSPQGLHSLTGRRILPLQIPAGQPSTPRGSGSSLLAGVFSCMDAQLMSRGCWGDASFSLSFLHTGALGGPRVCFCGHTCVLWAHLFCVASVAASTRWRFGWW